MTPRARRAQKAADFDIFEDKIHSQESSSDWLEWDCKPSPAVTSIPRSPAGGPSTYDTTESDPLIIPNPDLSLIRGQVERHLAGQFEWIVTYSGPGSSEDNNDNNNVGSTEDSHSVEAE
ncbi:hypothetical protein GMORB2_6453 [Geosmithia morbida]|uniref:Uncharacterized protein n=1 Tax=Geosmithia morbida TaxID=1094350 RepID=A0A9P5D2D6_9HYPO|nr:uncharacterized protein GMORB2_6453 [Geosmithia morbida]KAF4123752.1 hypothetical protein GMORB2_6453 [Geosmithia morbida]